MAARVTLEQWRAFLAVVDHGGYAQAAEKLHRSQSSISYGVAKLQQQLGAELLVVEGRKARLTELGEIMVRRARQLLQDAADIELLAGQWAAGWVPEIELVVDAAFPNRLLMVALKRFAQISQGTQVRLREEILSGVDAALQSGTVDLAIAAQVPDGFLGGQLLEIEFAAVAHRDHPLHQHGRPLISRDISREVQVVVSDSGPQQRDVGWLDAKQRWTVSSLETAEAVLCEGLGFGWLPRHQVQPRLDSGELKILPLREGACYRAQLYLIYGQPGEPDLASQALAQVFSELVPDSAVE